MNAVVLDSGSARGLPTGHFALRLDVATGSEITRLARSDGGRIYADVTEVLEAESHFAKKHLGPPQYQPFVIQVGTSMSEGLFAWIAGSWGPQPKALTGAVLASDHEFNVQRETAFSRALIAETRVPTLDAASKDPGFMTIRFQPEFLDSKAGAGKLPSMPATQKPWRSSNFTLEIAGLDCTGVKKTDSFVVARTIVEVRSGSGDLSLLPERVEFPNLRITLSASSAKTWFDWHRSFVVEANNSDNFERSGTIRFLTDDGQQDLSRIDLYHLGVISVATDPSDDLEAVATVTAELYCEEMRLVRA